MRMRGMRSGLIAGCRGEVADELGTIYCFCSASVGVYMALAFLLNVFRRPFSQRLPEGTVYSENQCVNSFRISPLMTLIECLPPWSTVTFSKLVPFSLRRQTSLPLHPQISHAMPSSFPPIQQHLHNHHPLFGHDSHP